jgi:hypothetical protein
MMGGILPFLDLSQFGVVGVGMDIVVFMGNKGEHYRL